MADTVAAVVGLGNPGAKYDDTRHNAGYWLVDELARRAHAGWRAQTRLHGEHALIDVPGGRLHLLKPTTFMNASGRAIRALADYYQLTPDQIVVAHDELDLPPGTARLKVGGGAGGHNGLKDTIKCLGPDFRRLRLGIGHPGHKDRVLGYVLSAPGKADHEAICAAVDASADALGHWLTAGWDRTVARLHSKD